MTNIEARRLAGNPKTNVLLGILNKSDFQMIGGSLGGGFLLPEGDWDYAEVAHWNLAASPSAPAPVEA